MYAQVVVLTYQPPDIPAYTYKIPKEQEQEINIGQLVSVPFGKRNPMGIIISLNTQPHVISAKLVLDHDRGAGIHSKKDWLPDQVGDDRKKTQIKPINSIIFHTSILLPYQIDLLKWMAHYYHAPMVNCLEAMLPEIPRKLSVAGLIPVRDSAGINPDGVGQTIVLIPSINRIPETLALYPQSKNYAVYHNELAVSEKFSAWQRILSGNVDYVFGSRLAIFSPCPNLQEIIIYDEHEEGYCDERSPYYSTLTIAEKLQELTDAKLKIIDDSPKITTYFVHGKDVILGSTSTSLSVNSTTPESASSKKNVLSGQARLATRAERARMTVRPPIKIKIVNMLEEKKAGNKSPLAQILEDYIKLGYARGKKILLFLNKKSESGHLYCRNCKYSDFAPKQPDVCPQCRSLDIFFYSTNVNSLASLVQKIIKNAKVNIITKSTQLPNYPTTQLPTIDIATTSVFYKLLTQKYDLVAHIQTDSLINIPDFTSAEKLYSQIASLKKITRKLLLLQTYNPQNPTITASAQDQWQKFYQSQLAERKALSYPPFSLLVKLSLKDKKEESVKQNAQQLFKDLNSQLSTFNSQLLAILGPYKPTASGKLPKYNIILKIPLAGYLLKEREKANSKVSFLLLTVPKGTQIEVEANSLN